jgi:hypothetical protein
MLKALVSLAVHGTTHADGPHPKTSARETSSNSQNSLLEWGAPIGRGDVWAMRKLLFFLLYAAPVLAQGTPYENYVVAANGPNGSLTPITFAKITVCAGVHTEIPCTPAVTLYSDLALTQVISPPLISGPLGNYRFVVLPGTYSISITGPGITAPNDVVKLPNDSSNGGLWAGPGATPTIATQEAAAVAAGGGVVNIAAGYTGPESSNCSRNGADRFNTWSGNPIVEIVDWRTGPTVCQYNVQFNSIPSYGLAPFAGTKFFSSPSTTASAGIFTSKYSGSLTAGGGNLNGLTTEMDVVGAVSGSPATMSSNIGESHVRSTGGTISDLAGYSAFASIDRTATTTNVTRAYGYFANACTNSSTSGAVISHCYGFYTNHNTAGSVDNYAFFSNGKIRLAYFSGDNGIDLESTGGVATTVLKNDGTDTLTISALTGKGIAIAAEPIATGSQNVSGCSLTNALGGAWAGSFKSGTSGTCTVTITPGITAPNGFACDAHDLTTAADANNMVQTAYNQTTATIAGTTVSADLITWKCVAF